MISKIYRILFVLFFIGFPTYLVAQVKTSINAEYLIPLMKLRDNYEYGLSSSIGIKYTVQEEIDLLFDAGYSYIKGIHQEDQYIRYGIPSLKALPLNLGIRYNADKLFFLQVSGGPLWIIDPNQRFGWQYSGGAGIRYSHFELSGRLMQWNNGGIINFAGLKLTYSL